MWFSILIKHISVIFLCICHQIFYPFLIFNFFCVVLYDTAPDSRLLPFGFNAVSVPQSQNLTRNPNFTNSSTASYTSLLLNSFAFNNSPVRTENFHDLILVILVHCIANLCCLVLFLGFPTILGKI